MSPSDSHITPAGPGAARPRLQNYPGRGFLHMTKAEWRRLPRTCKGAWLEGLGMAQAGGHPVRVALVSGAALAPVYIVDSVLIDPRPAA
jgi:hypothetical protein